MNQRPLIGVGVIVIKDSKVLLGKRRGAHGNGTWALPGGHLEWGESLEACAHREVLEECNVYITNIRRGSFTNDIFEDSNKHYVTLFMIADYELGELRVCEPDKCEQWGWFDWNDLPKPLFLPLKNLIDQGYLLQNN